MKTTRRATCGALAALSLYAAPSWAQTKAKPNPAAEVETLKAELKKTQDDLAAAKASAEQDQAKLTALSDKVAALESQLATANAQLSTLTVDAEARSALAAERAARAALESRLSSLEGEVANVKEQGKEKLFVFGYLAANLRFLDLPDVENADGTIDQRRDTDFFNNVVELDLERRYGDFARVRADLLVNFNPGNAAAPLGRAFQIDTEQAFIELGPADSDYLIPPDWTNPGLAPARPFSLVFGRFDAPWGFEPVNAPGNYCVTRSNLFQLIRPKLYTGAMGIANWSEQFSTSLYVVNGLEDNFDVKNNFKTIGGRVDLSGAPAQGKRPWSIGLNFVAGSEQLAANVGDNASRRFPDPTLLGGFDYKINLGKLLIGGDALFGTIFDAQGGIPANQGANPIFGLNATARLEITERLAYTMRYDAFVDRQGALAGASAAVPLYPARPAGDVDTNVGGTLHGVTLDLNFALRPNAPLWTFLEYRLDRFDPTESGESTTAQTMSLQFIYSY
jgi:hypothetical protein